MDGEHTPIWSDRRVSLQSTRDPSLMDEIILCLKKDWMCFVYESDGFKPSFEASQGPDNDPLFITVENTVRDIARLWPVNYLPYLTLTWGDPSDSKTYVFFYTDDGSETWHPLIPKLWKLKAIEAKNKLEALGRQFSDGKKRQKKINKIQRAEQLPGTHHRDRNNRTNKV